MFEDSNLLKFAVSFQQNGYKLTSTLYRTQRVKIQNLKSDYSEIWYNGERSSLQESKSLVGSGTPLEQKPKS